MSDEELDEETRASIALARAETHAPAVSRARVWQGLELQLAAPSSVVALSSVAAAKVWVVAAVLTAATGVWYVGRHAGAPHEPGAPRLVPAARAAEPAAPPSESAATTLPLTLPSAMPRVTRTPERALSTLARETALLREVTAALHGHDGRRALALLGRHERRYRGGPLRAEREAARIFALCSLGRATKARAFAARFLQTWPHSPLAARVRSSCGSPQSPKAPEADVFDP